MTPLSRLIGSERRFIAFVLALVVITLSGPLKLDGSAMTALVTLALGYIGQGAAKEAVLGRKP